MKKRVIGAFMGDGEIIDTEGTMTTATVALIEYLRKTESELEDD